ERSQRASWLLSKSSTVRRSSSKSRSDRGEARTGRDGSARPPRVLRVRLPICITGGGAATLGNGSEWSDNDAPPRHRKETSHGHCRRTTRAGRTGLLQLGGGSQPVRIHRLLSENSSLFRRNAVLHAGRHGISGVGYGIGQDRGDDLFRLVLP